MAGRKWRAAYALITIPLGIVLLITMPIWFAVIILGVKLYKRDLRRAARAFVCLNCAHILGDQAVDVADRYLVDHVREFERKHPGVKYRVTRRAEAMCPRCNAQYAFRQGTLAATANGVEVIPVTQSGASGQGGHRPPVGA